MSVITFLCGFTMTLFAGMSPFIPLMVHGEQSDCRRDGEKRDGKNAPPPVRDNPPPSLAASGATLLILSVLAHSRDDTMGDFEDSARPLLFTARPTQTVGLRV